ncbi:MAG: hypothetical protein WDN25_30210 [Acetobacteraceae bacterium]
MILLACLAASCSKMTPEQQARLDQAVTVACNVDGVVVPVAQPVVATMGTGGATAASIDALLVHPAVVQACAALKGTPASVTVTAPAAPATPPAKPVS